MSVELLTFGEALVEIMRVDIDQPLHQPGAFMGPYPSGAPFIFATQAARLGTSIHIIGSVGKDAFGQCILEQLREDKIATSGIRVLDSHSTGVAFVAYNSDSTRDFVFSLGAGVELSVDMLDASLFEGLRCLHLMGSTLSLNDKVYEMGLYALQLAREHHVKVSFDPNLRPELMSLEKAREAFVPFIESADFLIPTESELLSLLDVDDVQSAVDTLLEKHSQKVIVVTQGEKGCAVYSQDGIQSIVSYTIAEVDPTGAGDCFDAGFLAGWLKGWSYLEAARLANACGALAVTRQGPMAGAEKLSIVQQFMNAEK